jgi:hypothetical protein
VTERVPHVLRLRLARPSIGATALLGWGDPGQDVAMAGRKLKVFQAQIGFYDTVVAAPSRAAALRAWGMRQDLFANGEASLTTDEAAKVAAVAHPQTPLRRAIGSSDPFALEPAGLPSIPAAPKKATKRSPKPSAARTPKPEADRSELDAAEKALHDLDERRIEEEADFRRMQADLDARVAQAQSAYVTARKAVAATVAKARAVYRKAGGET